MACFAIIKNFQCSKVASFSRTECWVPNASSTFNGNSSENSATPTIQRCASDLAVRTYQHMRVTVSALKECSDKPRKWETDSGHLGLTRLLSWLLPFDFEGLEVQDIPKAISLRPVLFGSQKSLKLLLHNGSFPLQPFLAHQAPRKQIIMDGQTVARTVEKHNDIPVCFTARENPLVNYLMQGSYPLN